MALSVQITVTDLTSVTKSSLTDADANMFMTVVSHGCLQWVTTPW